MNRILFAVALFLLVGVSTAAAQVPGQQRPGGPPPGAELSGRIVGGDANESVAGATVAVWSPADSSIVTGAVVREDGAFQIQGVPPGTYYIRITSIGYASHRSDDFTVAPGTPRTDLGVIRLSRADIQADEIQVTVERPTITLEPDKNTYVARDVAPGATSATEILEAIPSVQVDADGKVSLRGNENVAVQINGRPTPVRGDQLASFLQQLPANAIERVEVIPTPSARHDPEGMAGIVNLVLKQNTDLGRSGGFTLGAAGSERYNLGGSFGYQSGPTTLFTTYGFNRDARDFEGVTSRERFDATGSPLSFSVQDLTGENGRRGHNLTNTFEYRLGERDVLSSSLVANLRNSTELAFGAYTDRDADGDVVATYLRPRDGENDSWLFDHTLGLKRTYAPRTHELGGEFRFSRSSDDETTLLWEQVTGSSTRTDLEENVVDATTWETAAQLDYVRPLGTEGTKLELGYKGTARWLDRDFAVREDALGSGDWLVSDRSNAFEFDENVQAIYGVVTRGAGEFELQAGLRGEYATQDFALADESFPHDYTSLFPSGLISWAPNEQNQLKLSYSRRIRRPGTQELNPFPVFFDDQTVFVGNPELSPEYTDAIELGYTRQGNLGTLQFSPFYRRTSDIIRFVVDTDAVIDGEPVTQVSFENLENSDSYGTDLNGSIEIGEWFDGFASFNVFKMVTDGGSETSLSSNAVTWSTRLNGTFTLTPTLSLQGMTMYRAPMEFETGKFSSFKMTVFTLRQKLFDDRATLSLRLMDPFKTMGFRVETGDENLNQTTQRKFDSRVLNLTFQYNFGRAPRVRQPQPQQGQEPSVGFPQ